MNFVHRIRESVANQDAYDDRDGGMYEDYGRTGEVALYNPYGKDSQYDNDNDSEPEEETYNTDFDDAVSGITSMTEAEKFKIFQTVLDMVCEASLDPVVIITEKGIIKAINEETQALFGYKRWEVMGKNVKMLMPPRFAEKHDSFLHRYLKTKMKRIIGERRTGIVALHKNGEHLPVVLKVQELFDSAGTPAFIGVIKSLTMDEELYRIRDMINNMLPPRISQRIQDGEAVIADEVYATVAFLDFVGFNEFMDKVDGKEVVETLNHFFNKMDELAQGFDVDKIKTIGDIYMCCCGHVNTMYDHAVRMVEFCLDVIEYMKTTTFSIRVGIATGPMISGVLNGTKLSFDLWGDTVNVASRLEHVCPPNRACVSSQTYEETRFKYKFDPVQSREIKGKGIMQYYFIQERK